MAETNTPILPDEPTRPPLWKQLLGALGGAAIALALYSSYEAASPSLAAWLSIPKETPRSDTGDVAVPGSASEEMKKRIASRARAIAEEFSERPEHPVEEVEAVPSEAESAFPVTESPSDSIAEQVADTAPVPTSEPSEEIWEEAEEESVLSEWESPAPAIRLQAHGREEDAIAQTSVQTPKAPSLPSSGVGVWLVSFLSILGAVGWKYRKRLDQEIISF